MNDEELLQAGKTVILNEAAELVRAAGEMGAEIVMASRLLYECAGRVVVVGMGKSGHVGRKIAATLASLGTPSFFLHAAEGSHGDLGMVCRGDVGLFVSNSGETAEVLAILPHFNRLGAKLIAITGGMDSTLARNADIVIHSGVNFEADPLRLAPTSSTTLQLVIGDALAGIVTLLRGLKREDFAELHPGGALGRRLLTKISDVMCTQGDLPVVRLDVSVKDALFEITDKKYGATCVVDETGELVGIFTDGDFRRLIEARGVDALNSPIHESMTRSPCVIEPTRLAAAAVKLMEERSISVLVVVTQSPMGGLFPVGMVHFHELLSSGVA